MAGPPRVGTSALDQMPPSPGSVGSNPGMSPTLDAGGAMQTPPLPGLAQMGAPLQIGSDQLPPEILQGVMAVGQTLTQQLDTLAQVAPDLGTDFAAVKQLLLATLAKLLTKGAPPSSPTSPGSAFPGVTGGMDRGRPF